MDGAVFIGHNDCYGISAEKLEKEIIKCVNEGVTVFFNGGQGGFDRLSAGIIYKLKKIYPNIKNVLVIPYLNFRIFDREIFDEIIYPEGFERLHFKSAIIEKNKYMVDNSKYAICFVSHSWGGAYKTYEYALIKGLDIRNLSQIKKDDVI